MELQWSTTLSREVAGSILAIVVFYPIFSTCAVSGLSDVTNFQISDLKLLFSFALNQKYRSSNYFRAKARYVHCRNSLENGELPISAMIPCHDLIFKDPQAT